MAVDMAAGQAGAAPTPDLAALQQVTGEFKKGWRTTEWWLAAISAVVPAGAWLAALFGYDVDAEALGGSLAGLIPGVAYILSRGWVKKQRNVTVAQVAAGAVTAITQPDIMEQVREAVREALTSDPELAEVVQQIEAKQDLAPLADEIQTEGDPEAEGTDTAVPPGWTPPPGGVPGP